LTTTEERLSLAQTLADETSGPSGLEPVEGIWEKIDKRFQAHQGLISRMEKSMGKWRIERYVPPVTEAVDPENAYTSNLDGVLARKVVYSIAGSSPRVRIENDAAWPDRKTANENAERFAIGCLNIGDEMQRKRAQPTIIKQLAFFATVRGGYVVCRGLLNKNKAGETFPDWLPMDPRNFVFSRGSDGLEWCAYRFELTRAEIRKRWPKFSFSVHGDDPYITEDETKAEVVYDFYERRGGQVLSVDMEGMPVLREKEFFYNGVLIDHRFAREMGDTHAVEWPITVVPVGYMPELGTQHPVTNKDTSRDFGEDVFALTQGITDTIDLVGSYATQAIAGQVHPAYKKKGSGGGPDTPDYPLAAGQETNLDSDADQDIEPYRPPDIGMAPRMLFDIATSEWYAGGLTAHALGQMPPGGLSGAALRLVGSNIGERSHPFLGPVQECIESCLSAQLAQFDEGGYGPLEVWGKTLSDARFDRPISSEDVAGHGRLSFHLLQHLPEDDLQKWTIAEMATRPDQTGKRLVPPEWAQSNLLGIEDTSLMNQQQDVERVKDMMPLITLLDWRESAEKSGEMNVVAYLDRKIEEEFTKDYLQQLVLKYQMIQIGGQGSLAELMAFVGGLREGGLEGNVGGKPKGMTSAGMSMENLRPGTTGRNPSPEAGLNSPNPRPGSRVEEDSRLNAAGLVRG